MSFDLVSSHLPYTKIDSELIWKPVLGYPERLEKLKSIFLQTLEPLYGSQKLALDKIENGNDRTCTLLYKNKDAVGVLVYKNQLSKEYREYGVLQSLEIKSLFLINPEKNSGNGYASILLKKVIEIAKLKFASSIHVTVSEKVQDSYEFFKKKNFSVVHTFHSLYQEGVIEYLFQLKLESEKAGDEKEMMEIPEKRIKKIKPPSSKRKRDFEENSCNKKTKITIGSKEKNDSQIIQQADEKENHALSSLFLSNASCQIQYKGLRIKKNYLDMIAAGTKTVEVRICKGRFKNFKKNQGIRFYVGLEGVKCLITNVKVYKSFEAMFDSTKEDSENYKNLIPTARSAADVLKAYHAIKGYTKNAIDFGVVAIHIKKI